ncbi:MAG: hypothetical protein M3024_05690 [Candidatus Dormibacteraeota bacterium]|nr:hypothetical protein [Candidatus Dormibacteraeota bacterium]
MLVTFAKLSLRQYGVSAVLDSGQRMLGPGPNGEAPGNDQHMPHDLAHFLVEAELGLRLGVFGQLAAGEAGIFRPEATERKAKRVRRGRQVRAAGRGDINASERLVWLCVSEWERLAGRRSQPMEMLPTNTGDVPPERLERAISRLDLESARWRALEVGESMTLTWPPHLTVRPGKSQLTKGREHQHDR